MYFTEATFPISGQHICGGRTNSHSMQNSGLDSSPAETKATEQTKPVSSEAAWRPPLLPVETYAVSRIFHRPTEGPSLGRTEPSLPCLLKLATQASILLCSKRRLRS